MDGKLSAAEEIAAWRAILLVEDEENEKDENEKECDNSDSVSKSSASPKEVNTEANNPDADTDYPSPNGYYTFSQALRNDKTGYTSHLTLLEKHVEA